jgi:ribosomal protein S18 acetylase RimI-like enzyme
MELRELRADEGLAYREIRLRALREAPDAFASTLEEESAQPELFWQELIAQTAEAMEAALLAVDRGDGSLGGTTFVRLNPDPPHDGYVGGMWLDRDLRGQGWGDALLVTAERFSQRLGSKNLELWVGASNPPALRFYERNGYQLTGVEEAQSSGIIARMMLKPLLPF